MTAVLESYDRLLGAGELRPDPDQRRAAEMLDRLAGQLDGGARRSLFQRLLGKAPPRPRGVYVWGGVGRGKSMLMDLAFGSIAVPRKRRVHFHEFSQVPSGCASERYGAGDPIERSTGDRRADLGFDEM